MDYRKTVEKTFVLLTELARERKVVTYEHVGLHIGYPTRYLKRILDPIDDYCMKNSLPPLTKLVISKDILLSEVGYQLTSGTYGYEIQEIFDFDWNVVEIKI